MTAKRSPQYPFTPRSRTHVRPGQYWAVPLSDGRFACGRVLQVTGEELPNSVCFFGGLHDWVGERPPDSDAIGGRSLLRVGVMHVKAITQTGGMVLGLRPLEVDELISPLLLSAQGGRGTRLMRGAQHLRIAKPADLGSYPVLGFWGYDFIRQLAEELLVRRGHNDAA